VLPLAARKLKYPPPPAAAMGFVGEVRETACCCTRAGRAWLSWIDPPPPLTRCPPARPSARPQTIDTLRRMDWREVHMILTRFAFCCRSVPCCCPELERTTAGAGRLARLCGNPPLPPCCLLMLVLVLVLMPVLRVACILLQLAQQLVNLGMILSSALIIWKSLILFTASESPVVVVLRSAPLPSAPATSPACQHAEPVRRSTARTHAVGTKGASL
jgi:hypothetical protein